MQTCTQTPADTPAHATQMALLLLALVVFTRAQDTSVCGVGGSVCGVGGGVCGVGGGTGSDCVTTTLPNPSVCARNTKPGLSNNYCMRAEMLAKVDSDDIW